MYIDVHTNNRIKLLSRPGLHSGISEPGFPTNLRPGHAGIATGITKGNIVAARESAEG
jgi:predicted AlkP superfamily pyrophosphatase or phosphodiesterase